VFPNRIPVYEANRSGGDVLADGVGGDEPAGPRDVVAQLRRMEWRTGRGWCSQRSSFPTALALLLGHILPLQPGGDGGLVFRGRGAGGSVDDAEYPKRGFDMQLPAGYQVWGSLLPIVLPLVVLVAGLLQGLTIWIPPRVVLLEIAENQFVPLLLGLALARFLPGFSIKAVVLFNRIGNVVLTVRIVALMWFMRQALKGLLTWWLPLRAMLLALGSVLAISLLARSDDPFGETYAGDLQCEPACGVGRAAERAISARERNAPGDCGVCGDCSVL
jgi:hypothetical protein